MLKLRAPTAEPRAPNEAERALLVALVAAGSAGLVIPPSPERQFIVNRRWVDSRPDPTPAKGKGGKPRLYTLTAGGRSFCRLNKIQPGG